MIVFFGNQQVYNNKEIDLNLVQPKPKVTIDIEPNNLYTLLMIDPDAPKDFEGQYYLHWLVMNIDTKGNKKIVTPFKPSTPGKDGIHHYYFYLYKQPGKIDIDKYEPHKFVLDDFVSKFSLGKSEDSFVYLTQRK